ncbi:hypothetical protein QCA50_006462 [Cerrena zonata]|uniref:Uncharacterized protein n=1 Tax=Cerrena zonata TaxID=2478898 RepID=A0AAW0GHV2_9APHY
MLFTRLPATRSNRNAATKFIRNKKVYYASIDYTLASEDVPNEQREEFRETLALLLERVADIEERLPHYYALLTELYIDRTIQIIETTKWQERLLYSPRGHSGYIFTLPQLRHALAALINVQTIALSLEFWSHTPEGLRLTREVPGGDISIQIAKDKWLKQNLTPISAHDNLEAVLDRLPKYALKECYSSPPSCPSLMSASSSSRSSLSPSPSPTLPFMPQRWPSPFFEDYHGLSCCDEGSVLHPSISSNHYHEDNDDTTSTVALKYENRNSPLREVWHKYLEPLFISSPHTTESDHYDSYSDLTSEYTDSEDEKEIHDMLMGDLDVTLPPNNNANFLPITTIHEPVSQSSHHWVILLLLPLWLQAARRFFTVFL